LGTGGRNVRFEKRFPIAIEPRKRISADGKTMTLNVAAVRPDGQEIPIVLVFKKR